MSRAGFEVFDWKNRMCGRVYLDRRGSWRGVSWDGVDYGPFRTDWHAEQWVRLKGARA